MSEWGTGITRAWVGLRSRERRQMGWVAQCPDDLVGADHPARLVAAVVEKLDVSRFHEPIKAREGQAGRDATGTRPGRGFRCRCGSVPASGASVRRGGLWRTLACNLMHFPAALLTWTATEHKKTATEHKNQPGTQPGRQKPAARARNPAPGTVRIADRTTIATAPQTERLIQSQPLSVDREGCRKRRKMAGALQSAEKLSEAAVLKGHGFIRANKSSKMAPALAAEGWFFRAGVGISSFSAACLAPAHSSFSGFAFHSDFFRDLGYSSHARATSCRKIDLG